MLAAANQISPLEGPDAWHPVLHATWLLAADPVYVRIQPEDIGAYNGHGPGRVVRAVARPICAVVV
jgi:hypothetical protein